MNAYSVFSKATGELIEVCKAPNNQTARIGASKEILEITMATADEIVEFTKRGGEIRVYQPESRKPKAAPVDPAQTDLVKEAARLDAEGEKRVISEPVVAPPVAPVLEVEDDVRQLQADAENRDPEPGVETYKPASDDPFGD